MVASGRHPLAKADRVRSVDRALRVLDVLAQEPAGLPAKAVARKLGASPATVYHALNTLTAGGYAVQDAETRLFALGPRIPHLHRAYLAQVQPSPGVLPFLTALQQATGETAHLVRLHGDDAVAVAVAQGQAAEALPAGEPGFSLPAHAIAAGRVLLAFSPPARIRAYLGGRYAHDAGGLPPADPILLPRDLDRIRAAGYAVDRGGGRAGVCCVAAPVGGPEERASEALVLLTSCRRFARDDRQLVDAVLAVAGAAAQARAVTPPAATEHPVGAAARAASWRATEPPG